MSKSKKRGHKTIAIGAIIVLATLLLINLAGWSMYNLLNQASTDILASYGITGDYAPNVAIVVFVLVFVIVMSQFGLFKKFGIGKAVNKILGTD
jgi:uncharacterized membrane protein YidH (DUF202 family)